ncbi:MAG: glycosyl hydrolase 115 family protein, partial [Oscillospiraceae bacterium]|nr:glycosyl hydrolase 115 family protein [Oscillospiraceae bacterium]
SDVTGKREVFRLQLVSSPSDGIENALIVAGSEKRAVFYGLYHLSSLMGVSPWVYWADITPEKKYSLELSADEADFTSREPSVKYRGIFLNDEWPSLGSWVMSAFGGFNELFYARVFELILRLRGNFLWPAMWSAVFSEDGLSEPLACAKLADAYGIVMGTSHHEPMFRAGEEWKRICGRYGSDPAWDFASNADAITAFWEDGLKRNKGLESLITIGMRGENDSALFGSAGDNIRLLKRIIKVQKQLLEKHGLSDAPQVLTIYKEVEKYWYGSPDEEGLRYWDGLDGVTVMMTDDNFANLRTLPAESERNRPGGWGMYYHFDYHGGPRSYEWVNVTPLVKIWEQMSMAYDCGVREVWVVNTGDLKPMELPISYFLDLAYDFDSLGTAGINRIREYTLAWAREQFGRCGERAVLLAADILDAYTRMSGARKPEITFPHTYSLLHYDEARRVLDAALALEAKAEECAALIDADLADAYYQLVYYPAVATANVIKMQIYAGLNEWFCREKSALGNEYARLGWACVEKDREMQAYFNDKMSSGKWRGIMSSPHVGYRMWTPDSGAYPVYSKTALRDGSVLMVNTCGRYSACTDAEAVSLPPFSESGGEKYRLTVSNGGNIPFECRLETDADWIELDRSEAVISTGADFFVSLRPGVLRSDAEGSVTVTGAGQKVVIGVSAVIRDLSDVSAGAFIEFGGTVSAEAEHFSARKPGGGAEWKLIEDYGRTLSSMKMYPDTLSFEDFREAPYLEYTFFLFDPGRYTLTVFTAPTNNLAENGGLRFAVSFDSAPAQIVNALPEGYITGSYANELWQNAVMDNIHLASSSHELSAGTHTLRLYGMDAGLVLQKLVLSSAPLPGSYFGPPESARAPGRK